MAGVIGPMLGVSVGLHEVAVNSRLLMGYAPDAVVPVGLMVAAPAAATLTAVLSGYVPAQLAGGTDLKEILLHE
jgi:hypothetical protein